MAEIVEQTAEQIVESNEYKYGFVTDIESEFAPKGLNEEIIRFISAKKEEPDWLLAWRLEAFRKGEPSPFYSFSPPTSLIFEG